MNNTEIDIKFYQALKNNDSSKLSMIPKSDVHNHAGRGGKIEDLSSEITPPDKPFASLNDMQTWFENSVKSRLMPGIDGYLYRVEASFKQADKDNIKKLALSFGLGEIDSLDGIENFAKVMNTFKSMYIPDSDFIPELSLMRSEIPEDEIAKAKDVISYNWFKSLDVCGNEHAASLDKYLPLYQYAKAKSLLLKVHVGEFGTAFDVVKAIDLLELDEVHHGIAAADSKDSMRFIRENRVILNICPTSNIMLQRVENYSSHPIRKLYDAGVHITINTDDLTIFNATVSDEYLNLYNNEVFSAEELNHIRVGGLSSYHKY